MRFHRGHEAIYGHHDVESPVEFVSFRAVQTYSPPKPSLPRLTIKGTLSDAQKGKREAYFEGHKKPIQTPIYDRWKLPIGGKLKGSAIIEQEDTTTVIYPGHEAHLDDFGNVVINIP
jgi:N-methylhydantoinase A